MPDPANYLLGYGERLTESIAIQSGGGPKEWPYSFEQARDRVKPMLDDTVEIMQQLPPSACPRDQAVARVTLHPEFYAKSYYPGALLESTGLRAIGSRARTISPQNRTRGRHPVAAITTELFLAGARDSFRELGNSLPGWNPKSTASDNVRAIEEICAMSAEDRLRSFADAERRQVPLEVVLHASRRDIDKYIVAGFEDYVSELDLELDTKTIFYSGGLCFLRLRATRGEAQELAKYSFLRVVRQMPPLRLNDPDTATRSIPVSLPDKDGLDPQLRVAVFDGGIHPTSPLTRWVTPIDAPGVGPAEPELLNHGEGVTSALLFGSLNPTSVDRPPCHVDHHRVLDVASGRDDYQLFDVLQRLKDILDSSNYEFFNLSIGPELPIDDEDVHVWTAVLDEYLSDGHKLATIAAGNTGERLKDLEIQPWRIQVPSDCVNAITVGAADSSGPKWERTQYSSFGPGRSPGVVKPDLVTHGGRMRSLF